MGETRAYLAIVFLTASGLGAAAGPSPIPAAEHRSLEQFAAANKDCNEWSDGCAVCRRGGDGGFACSLPGIACQPKDLACEATSRGKTVEGGSAQ